MLPAAHRLRTAEDFAHTVRRGRRASAPDLVVHLCLAADAPADRPAVATAPTQVGFVVSRAVGPAVIRNRVKRRLRHLTRARLTQVPPGSRAVIRALPGAAALSSADLGAELDRCLDRLTTRVRR